MSKLLQQLIKFGIIGVMATVIDFAVLTGLTELVGVHYLVSAAIGFLVANVFNYLFSMRYVFKSRFTKEERHKEFLLFVMLSVFGLAFNQLFMWLFVEVVGLYYLIGKVLATIFVMIWNFISRKLWME